MQINREAAPVEIKDSQTAGYWRNYSCQILLIYIRRSISKEIAGAGKQALSNDKMKRVFGYYGFEFD